MSHIAAAIARANRGLDWSYPCLIWIADYLRDATGRDPAESWRHVKWDEAGARHSLARLAVAGEGETAVERALDAIARRDGWIESDLMMQGAVMVGVYDAASLIDGQDERIGVPAIYDGQRRWLVSNDGNGVASIEIKPRRMWEVPRA